MAVYSNTLSAQQDDMSGCLFVGDLHRRVTEQNLLDTFVPYGPIFSVEVVRDRATGCSRGFGYVNFAHVSDAKMAMDNLMCQDLLGRPMNIMRYHAKPTSRQTRIGNICIKGLAKDIDSLALYDTFSVFGDILSCKVATNRFGSKGYGFVHFESMEAADKAVRTLDGMLLNDEQVSITHCKTHMERQVEQTANQQSTDCSKGCLFVGDLHPCVTEQHLLDTFVPYGPIFSVEVVRDRATGCSRGFGYVNFAHVSDAKMAMDNLMCQDLLGRPMNIMRYHAKPTSRQTRIGNICIKGLAKDIDSLALYDTFSVFGDILSCKVATNRFGSKGYGFVHFESMEAADKAVRTLDGMLLNDEKVSITHCKTHMERQVEQTANQQSTDCSEGCLFVGDLHPCVTEQHLLDTFVPYGPIFSVEVVRDRATGCSRGFGYVNFAHVSDAKMAMDNLMCQDLLGRPMRIMRYHPDPTLRQTRIGNICIKGLAKDIDSLALYDTFSVFGEILSCKVATNRFGSKGYGFVHFESMEAADKAVRTLDGMLLNDEKVSITHCKTHMERQVEQTANQQSTDCSEECLFVGDLHPCVTEQHLLDTFVPYGPIFSVEVVRDRATGCSRGFGYVNFAHVSDAKMAMDNLMCQDLLGRPMRIMRYHPDPTLRQTRIGNICIKGLAKDIDSLALYDTFSVFGEILSCKVATNRFGSKGYGFVHFKSMEAADKAVRTLDGMLLNDEQVSITHCKTHMERQVEQNAKETKPKSFPPSLYVCNLPYHFTSQQLNELFSQFGIVLRATVMTHNGRSKGFGFVILESDEATSKALAAMNGHLVGNRKLYVTLSNSAEKKRERAASRKQQSTECSDCL